MYRRPLLFFAPKRWVQRQVLSPALNLGFGPEGEGYVRDKDRDGREIWVIKRPPMVTSSAVKDNDHVLAAASFDSDLGQGVGRAPQSRTGNENRGGSGVQAGEAEADAGADVGGGAAAEREADRVHDVYFTYIFRNPGTASLLPVLQVHTRSHRFCETYYCESFAAAILLLPYY